MRLVPLLLLLLLWASTSWGQPLLEYTFDDQANPTANGGTLGATYDGALVGDATFVPFGGGSAVALDGDQDVVSPGGDPTAFNVGDGDFSLFARFQTSNSEPGAIGNRFLVKRDSTGDSPTFVMGVLRDGGTVTFSLANGAGFVTVETTVPVNDGATHEVLAVRSGDVLRLFLDGSFDAETTIPTGYSGTDSSDPLTIGGRLISTDDDFLGLLDEIAIYDVALDEGCGDGIALGGEECDDGNTAPGDGCSAECLSELSPCEAGPAAGCVAFSKGSLSIKETKPGSEKWKVSLKSPASPLPGGAFGDPAGGTTRFDVCLYDDADALVAELVVDRAGDLCGTKQKPCWKSGKSGFTYKDPDAASGGVKKLTAKNKGALAVQAGNKASKGQGSLPTGSAAALQASTSPLVQVRTSDGECFAATFGTIKKADGTQYKAKAP